MAIDREAVRNVFIYNSSTGLSLGGMRQNGSITEAVFLWILRYILLIAEDELHVIARTTQQPISPTDNPLEPGDYDIYSNGTIKLTDESCVLRILSHSISGQEESFRKGVRERDKKCVISGMRNRNAAIDNWTGFQAAHIFPLEKETLWTQGHLEQWITDTDEAAGSTKINSCQNGLLLRNDVHNLFDNYLISVNPDDNYRITAFDFDNAELDGRTLDPVCLDPANPHHVPDQLLRWHFRQSVLANMKGAGEPIFEHDFPPGTDMVREIHEGPKAQERFEMEIASRLHGYKV